MDAQGALDSLLGRLTTVLVNEAQLLGGVRSDVEFIKDEMESMNSLILHLTEAQHRNHQVRTWMKQVVDLTHDCGGNVELYVHYVSGGPHRRGCLLGYIGRVLRFVRTVSVRHKIATRIQELKVRARDVGDRRLRYGVTVPAVVPDQQSTIFTDRPAPPPGRPEEEEDIRRRELLYGGEPPDTVEEGTKRVLEWLLRGETTSVIVGRGRVGKTAIARRVYEHPSIVSSFHFRFWVNFGGVHKDIWDVRKDIMDQYMDQYKMVGSSMTSPMDMHGKKVLFVFDAVRVPWLEWLLLNLPEVIDRAHYASIVTVSDQETVPNYLPELRKLPGYPEIFNVQTEATRPCFFRSRALALSNCFFGPVDEVLDECYPDVFALQMLLHLLYVNPNRSEREFNRLRDLLQANRNNIAKAMLMFCYNELPVNYKSCLLYLSVFPQDHPIRRTSLLRRWIAEGLISERSISTSSKGNPGMSSLEDQAEHIFDVFVARGFVRPGEISTSGKIKSFNVHHIVKEFIATDVSLVETSLPHHLAHRLSTSSGIAVQVAYSSNHELDITQTILESMPQSPQWKLLKVLDLEGCRGVKKRHLKSICKILLLRYLSLRNTNVTELPKQIEKLQCLETLDIRKTAITAFATKSVRLPMLKYLLAGHENPPRKHSDKFEKSFVTARLPSGIRKMQKLEILSHVEASDNIETLVDIGQLRQLRKLGVILNGKKGSLTLLFQQIEELHSCLRSLSVQINQPLVRSNSTTDTEVVPALVRPPKLLESLRICGISSGLPLWIAELDQLAKVTLRATLLGDDSINILGNLKMLCCLRLLHKSYTGNNLNFKAEQFQRLRSLVVEGSDITNISFDTGAAPKLERIIWSFARMESLFGINHLRKLKKLELDGDCNNLDPIIEALEVHPNHPELRHNPHHQSPQDDPAAAASSSSVP